MTDDDYKVGRGRPPKHTRYRKGQSGNPSGRPKGRPDPKALLEKRLFEEISIKGEREKLPAIDVLFTQLRNQALKGCKHSIILLRQWVQTVGLHDTQPPEEPQRNWTEADRALIKDFQRRHNDRDRAAKDGEHTAKDGYHPAKDGDDDV